MQGLIIHPNAHSRISALGGTELLESVPQRRKVETGDQLWLKINQQLHLSIELIGDKMAPLSVDFVAGAQAHRRKFGGGRQQDLAKATGLNKVWPLNIVDATAGLGRDAFVMATLGAKVQLCERNAVVRLLLADGLERAMQSDDMALVEIISRMHLIENETEMGTPDLIYLDPMFPSREKSAKVKKDMQIFHRLVGADEDADQLFDWALAFDPARIVVKRPKAAPFLAGKKAGLQFSGKSGRFDVYPFRKLGL